MLANVDGNTVKLTVKNAYSKGAEEKDVVAAIGQELTDKHFRQSVTLECAMDSIPEDQQDDFAQKVVALGGRRGASIGAISVKAFVTPRAGFHADRPARVAPEYRAEQGASTK